MIQCDILVIGAGVAGNSFAINMAEKRPDLKITMLTKSNRQESNTTYAQGGIAAVWDADIDNYEKHIADTLDAGDGLCDPEVVKIVVEEGPERVREIIEWGANFDKEADGDYRLGREGGHSENRILHYKDITGWEIQRALSEKVKTYDNIEVLEHFFAIDILTQHHMGRNVTRLTPGVECYGCYALNYDTKDIETILAKVTVMCTGGAGQVYKSTTNPVIATGDGIAMMYRAKGRIANMEFVQFHPTSLYSNNGENPSFLVSEAVRGFGAILRTSDGEEFMHKYDRRKSLAPRDIVARAIDKEMKMRGDDFVYLDCTHLDKDKFYDHFPNIHDKCMSQGIDPMKDFIPVVPACHYICGGILVDKMGATSIRNLYAAGECTCSGLHGANRLASNSLLEGLVFGQRVHLAVMNIIDNLEINNHIPDWNARGTTEPNEMVLITQSWRELKDIMSTYVGIVRTDVRLKRALDRLGLLWRETENLYVETTVSPQICELRNLITIAYLVTGAAKMRKESRGLHYNTDYPEHYGYLETTYQ
ncbi:MAG: L-aspartate oxidase [Saprospiraceae bacterium]|nr:L-aspartate oxidase [Saprospiraceae bacterium]